MSLENKPRVRTHGWPARQRRVMRPRIKREAGMCVCIYYSSILRIEDHTKKKNNKRTKKATGTINKFVDDHF